MRDNLDRDEQSFIQSFVVRCSLVEEEKIWRVKVTHVQYDEEHTFQSIEDAFGYMKAMMGE